VARKDKKERVTKNAKNQQRNANRALGTAGKKKLNSSVFGLTFESE
jgi:hypothetical protein